MGYETKSNKQVRQTKIHRQTTVRWGSWGGWVEKDKGGQIHGNKRIQCNIQMIYYRTVHLKPI